MKQTSKKEFKTPLYGTKFTVFFYETEDQLKKEFKGIKFDPPIENFDGGFLDHNGKYFVLFKTDKKGYPTPGIIAHEAKHLVNRIFIDICHPLCRYSDEPECYLLGWIVNRIHEMKSKINN